MKIFLKLIAWNFGILCFGFLIAETIFGSWFGAPQLWNLSVVRDINWKYDVSGHYRRETLVHYTRDKWGLRGDFGAPENVELVTIGGSTTDEGRVSNHETWPEVLETCLKSKGLRVEVANAGVGGQSSLGHKLSFKKWLNYVPKFKPKIALIFIGYNDRHRAGNRGQQDPLNYKGQTNNSDYHKIKKWIKINSAIYNLFQIIKGNIVAWNAELGPVRKRFKKFVSPKTVDFYEVDARDELYEDQTYVEVGTPEYEKIEKKVLAEYSAKLKGYHYRLGQLDKAVLEFGSIPIYVTQNAWGYWREGKRVYGKLEEYHVFNSINNVTRAFCKNMGRFCVDLASRYYFGPGHLYDHIHTTVQGSKKIGLTICEPLSKWMNAKNYFK